MSGRVENKIAVVTGGTSGIGLATAKLLAAEGAKVFVTGRRSPELAAAIEQIGHGAVGIQGDVSKLEDLDRLFTVVREQAGRLDILFANAGMAEHLTIEQVSESQFETGFSANVKGVFFCMQKALPLMPDEAAVVLNASMWTIKGIPGFGVLSASKAAVRSFARTWANELRERRIRVNVVSPGPVHTPSIEKATGGRDNAERLLSELSKDIPLGRPRQAGRDCKSGSIPRLKRCKLCERRGTFRRWRDGSDLAPIHLQKRVHSS